MRTHSRTTPWLLGALAMTAGFAVAHCSASTEAKTAAVSEALQTSGDSSDSLEVAGLLQSADAFTPDAVEAFRCDASPAVTYTTVCGQQLPATVDLSWTDCSIPQGRGGRCMGMGPDGGMPPAPPDGGERLPPPPPGACGSDGGVCQAGGPPPPGPSSGTVTIVNTYTTPNGCGAAIEDQQSVTFDVSRTEPNGDVSTDKGTATSTLEFLAGAPPTSKSTTINVTRSVTDSSGNALSSVELSGTRTETFSSATPPTRTVNESLTATFSDGTTSTVTLTNVVYPPMSTCRWPTSGALKETDSDGTSHTLVYGPTCGAATLDGAVIQLQSDDPGPGGPPADGPGNGPGGGAPRGSGGGTGR